MIADHRPGRRRRPRAGADPRRPAVRWSPTCRSRSSPRSTPSSGRCRAFLDGIFDDKVFVISFVSNVADRGADRLPRRQARRRRPAVHRRGRGARHPDLLQRGRHPAAHLPRMSDRRRAAPRASTNRTPPPGTRRRSRAKLLRGCCASRRAARLVVAVLVGVLGVRGGDPGAPRPSRTTRTPDCAQADLSRLLNGLHAGLAARPSADIADLEQTRDQLRRQHPAARRRRSSRRAEEVDDARDPRRHRARPAGPGIRITVNDPKDELSLQPPARRGRGAARRRVPRRSRSTTTCGSSPRPPSRTTGDGVRRRRPLDLKPPYVIDASATPTPWRRRSTSTDGFSDDVEADDGDGGGEEVGQREDHHGHRARIARLRLRPPTASNVRTAPGRQSSRRRHTRSSVIPEDLKYTAEHEWVREPGEAEGSVRVGITDYAQDALGDIVFVQLPEVGETVTAGAVRRRAGVDQVRQRGLRPARRRGRRAQRGARRDPRAGQHRPVRRRAGSSRSSPDNSGLGRPAWTRRPTATTLEA